MSEKTTTREDALVRAGADCLHLMHVMGWNEATTGENTEPEDMAMARACEKAYADLKSALGVSASFAALFVLQPIKDDSPTPDRP